MLFQNLPISQLISVMFTKSSLTRNNLAVKKNNYFQRNSFKIILIYKSFLVYTLENKFYNFETRWNVYQQLNIYALIRKVGDHSFFLSINFTIIALH